MSFKEAGFGGGGSTGGGAAPVTPHYELLDHHVAVAPEATYTFTPAVALDSDTYSKIVVVMNFEATAALVIQAKINAIVTMYYLQGTQVPTGGPTATIDDSNTAEWIIGNVGANQILQGQLELILPPTVFTNEGIMGKMYSDNSTAIARMAVCLNDVNNIAEISAVVIETSVSTWKVGSTITTYGVRVIPAP